MLGIVVSQADEASVHIGEQLRARSDWTERNDSTRPPESGGGRYWTTAGASLRTIEALHLDSVGVAEIFDKPSLVVFVSRHSGETGRLLSAHFTGNLGPAEYGGEPGALAEAAPEAATQVLATLSEAAPTGYEVTMECTHHGPSDVGAPSLFVELGSDQQAWRDPVGAGAVAEATLSLRDSVHTSDRNVICIGGDHYAARGTRIAMETDWHVGHIAAEWALEEMGAPSEAIVRDLFEQSEARFAVVEGDHPEICEIVDQLGYRTVSETWLRETEGVPYDRAQALEAELCSVEDGLRFGEKARDATTWTTTALPSELLQQCLGDDQTRTTTAVAENTVAYETADGGSRMGSRAAIEAESDLEGLLQRLTTILEDYHDEVRREAQEIVVTDLVFDPKEARERGVPEGPAFGRLAEGESVTVDGETVSPDQVRRRRTRRYEV